MKFNKDVSSSRRKCRKAHFSAHSTLKRRLMSAGLSKDLKKTHGARTMPIVKGDEVMIVSGAHKKHTGKVERVFRKKMQIFVEGLSREAHRRGVGTITVGVPVHPSNVVITKMKMNNNRTQILARRGNKVEAAADIE